MPMSTNIPAELVKKLRDRTGAGMMECKAALQEANGDLEEATTILRKENPTVPDFVSSPDEVISAQWCLAIAASEWVAKGCNALADQDAIRKITHAINGGLIGLAERIEWAKRTRAVWL